jgi:hypothetical protein
VVPKRTEDAVLADLSMGKTHPHGLFPRVGYYCVFCFSICGGGELHRLHREDFKLGKDCNGAFVKYHERTAKNGKASMTKFQPEHFRPAVKCNEADVVVTFTRYMFHLPDGMEEFFLSVINNPRTYAWYSKASMGIKCLRGLLREIFVENGLDPDKFTNKSGRATLVTRMAESGVPPEVGMLVTGQALTFVYFFLCFCLFCWFSSS